MKTIEEIMEEVANLSGYSSLNGMLNDIKRDKELIDHYMKVMMQAYSEHILKSN